MIFKIKTPCLFVGNGKHKTLFYTIEVKSLQIKPLSNTNSHTCNVHRSLAENVIPITKVFILNVNGQIRAAATLIYANSFKSKSQIRYHDKAGTSAQYFLLAGMMGSPLCIFTALNPVFLFCTFLILKFLGIRRLPITKENQTTRLKDTDNGNSF